MKIKVQFTIETDPDKKHKAAGQLQEAVADAVEKLGYKFDTVPTVHFPKGPKKATEKSDATATAQEQDEGSGD